jgi:hypothetical protein
MTLRRAARVLVLLLVFTPALFAAEDLSGKWGGTFITAVDGGPTHEDTAHMIAKQDGTDLTGTIGPNPDEQYTIMKGKVVTTKDEGKDVTKVTFDIVAGGNGPLAHFTLTLIDGHLKGEAKAEQDGHTMSAQLDLTRIK